MNNKKFSFHFNWQTIITFTFFSLTSFILIFFLGILVGKNSIPLPQNVFIPTEESSKEKKPEPKKNTDTKTITNKKPTEKTTEKTTEKPIQKVVKKIKISKPKSLIQEGSKETEDLFQENHYVIQVIAYKNKAKAENLQSLLKKNFYPAYIKETRKNGELYYRVRLGSYSYKEAKRVQQDIQKEFSNLQNTQIFSIK